MNEYYGRHAGEDDALSAFGLAHGTPRPPPSWAQEWLEGARSNGTKSLTIPSMREKKALFDPISLAIGGGLHVGSNIAQKILRRTNVGKKMEQSQFSSGLAHSLSGQKLHPATESVMRFGLGPESLAHYEAGHAMGKHLSGLTPDQRNAALKQLGSSVGESQYISGAPVARSMPGGIERFLKGEKGFMEKHLTSVPAGTKTPWYQRAVAPALGLATAAAAPHAIPQMAVNAIRDRLSKSRIGQSFAANELLQGARGKTISPIRRFATDMLLSPAANDPRAIGLAAHKEYGAAQEGMNKWLAARGHEPVQLPEANDVVDFAQGVHGRLNPKTPPKPEVPAAAPQSPGGGALTSALLAGGGLYALNNRMQPDDERR